MVNHMKLKKLIFPIILVGLIILEVCYLDKITSWASKIINNHHDIVIAPSNEYYKDYDFMFVKRSNDYTPYSYNDLLNIFYSIINNGWDEFTFYCPEEYENCINDVKNISSQEVLLTEINNYANPFNSFTTVHTTYDETGEINVNLTKVYSKEQIKEINALLDKIIEQNINDNMTLEEKITSLHDYIINNTQYDIEKNNTGISNYESNTAYGALTSHYATCNGYADTMALLLDRLGVKNYRIASDNHIWNAVYINDTWLHLDLTWDDPVSEDGINYLYHKYFLINNDQLRSEDKDLTDHIFDSSVYLEFKD